MTDLQGWVQHPVGDELGSRPLVSVIVAARNAGPYVGECIDALLAQTYSAFEVIIADDCSTDSTWGVLERYRGHPKVRLVRNDTQLLAAATRNRCLELAHGQYIMIQDADDMPRPDRMERLVTYLEQAQVDFVSSGFYLFDDSGPYRTVVPTDLAPSKTAFLLGSPFCHAATMFRRESLEAVGGYRVSRETRRGQDYDLFMRLYADGFTGANIQDVLYGYRVDACTKARRKLAYRVDECRIRWRGFDALGLMPWGLPFVAKPLLAHVLQSLSRRR